MGSNTQNDGGRGGRPQVTVSIVWQVLAVIGLSIVFAVIAKLLARALGIADTSNVALVGTILAVIMIAAAAPRSAKQFALVVAILLAGGTIAMLAALALRGIASGPWTDIVWAALASCLGAGFVVACYFLFGVLHRRRPPEDGT